jgi:hypothetical protein
MALADVDADGAAGASAGRRRAVLELASNDGTQLDAFAALGWDTHGVDPAGNLAPAARAPQGAGTRAQRRASASAMLAHAPHCAVATSDRLRTLDRERRRHVEQLGGRIG